MSQGVTVWTHIAGLIVSVCLLVPIFLVFRANRKPDDTESR
jgi:hypothetical protein